ncbi:hypothetical protein J437_LFUL009727 [Ladona fulva]|uniref:Ig-like domain-containing protein n=1 Tax=Ladona fulva TaxID=123851 RepID=A0A8K0KB04_LADFU|nr:hypothetical protein J437_LFUL009727 [Ladona fulva]
MLWIPHQLVGAPLGYSVTLECFTEAHPSSLNYWTREDGHMIHESHKYRAENVVGTPSYKTHMKLTISNIQEKDYGTYKCVAKNPRGETDGTIRLYIPPMLWIPHQLVGAPLGYSVTLECFTEAHPSSLNYWTREDGHMIHESHKYRAENVVGTPSYKTHMKLTISNIQEKDYGTYKCVAKNPRGETDGTIRLYSE